MSIITIVEEVMALQINHTGKELERMVYCDLIQLFSLTTAYACSVWPVLIHCMVL